MDDFNDRYKIQKPILRNFLFSLPALIWHICRSCIFGCEKRYSQKPHGLWQTCKRANFPNPHFLSTFVAMRFLSVIFIFPFLIAALELEIGSIEQTFHDEYDHYVINKVQTSDSFSLDQNAKPLKFPFGFLAVSYPYVPFNPNGYSRIKNTFGEVYHSTSKLFILFRSLLI